MKLRLPPIPSARIRPETVKADMFAVLASVLFGWLRRSTVSIRDVAHADVTGQVPVIACSRCGFDYGLRRIVYDGGKVGYLWLCDCGPRFIPQGGESAKLLVK